MPLCFLISALVVAVDLILKYLVQTGMTVGQSIPLIPGVLRLTYVQNRGAAFGSFSESRWVFLLLSTVMILFLCYFLAFRKGYAHSVYISFALMLGGGVGNMVDRVTLGYVIDYVDFCAIPAWVWVFNAADAAICTGVALFVVYLVFMEKRALLQGKKAIFADEPKKGEKDKETDGTNL